jgi:hypothetical protein
MGQTLVQPLTRGGKTPHALAAGRARSGPEGTAAKRTPGSGDPKGNAQNLVALVRQACYGWGMRESLPQSTISPFTQRVPGLSQVSPRSLRQAAESEGV